MSFLIGLVFAVLVSGVASGYAVWIYKDRAIAKEKALQAEAQQLKQTAQQAEKTLKG